VDSERKDKLGRLLSKFREDRLKSNRFLLRVNTSALSGNSVSSSFKAQSQRG